MGVLIFNRVIADEQNFRKATVWLPSKSTLSLSAFEKV